MEQTKNTSTTTQPNKSKDKDDILYVDINPDSPVSEIESLCMNCHEKGVTRLLMTKIPFFKEIIVMAFDCPKCGYRSNEIETATALSDQGIILELTVSTMKDMNRRTIKSNFATIKVPCCGFEIPPKTQKGKLTTLEGFLSNARDNFKASLDDGYYNEMGEDFISKIKELIANLTDALEGKKFPFKFILDDPSGNSFIENPYAPQTDQEIKVTFYNRTKEMLEEMGYSIENEKLDNQKEKKDKVIGTDSKQSNTESQSDQKQKKNFIDPKYYNKQKDFTVYKSNNEISNKIVDFTHSIENQEENIKNESLNLPTNCYCCGAMGVMHSCVITIPYFKEMLIFCFKCDECGYKTTDVKGGGGIADKGTKITLKVTTKEDLNRDVFKSESSKIIIPELGFETGTGSLGCMYTTVEGVIDKLATNLENMPFTNGDSSVDNSIPIFCAKLTRLLELNEPFTLIIDDPLSNSFIFLIGDIEKDTNLIKEEYERTFEQNEDFGINDMKVDNY